ncbi:MAG: hypothetical protein ACOYI5_05885 [Christensenellales bacterium]|jgi:hypothetical protein
MRYAGRLIVLGALLVAAIVMITSGTMAFYSRSISLTAMIQTAEFQLMVNESTGAEQTLADMTLAPGDARTRTVKIDTSGLGTPAQLTVTLTVRASGALPGGFSVSLGGEEATGTGELRAVKMIESAQDQVILMDVAAAWTALAGEDLEAYRDLEISYTVHVEAEQTAGG